jgi:hypothetical protein
MGDNHMGAMKHTMDAVAERMGINDPNDPRVLTEVAKALGDVTRKYRPDRFDFEEAVEELASEIALKWTSYEFDTLPKDEQFKIWQEAERQITDRMASEAEARRELMLDRKMG